MKDRNVNNTQGEPQLDDNDPVWQLLAKSPRPEPDAWFAVRTVGALPAIPDWVRNGLHFAASCAGHWVEASAYALRFFYWCRIRGMQRSLSNKIKMCRKPLRSWRRWILHRIPRLLLPPPHGKILRFRFYRDQEVRTPGGDCFFAGRPDSIFWNSVTSAIDRAACVHGTGQSGCGEIGVCNCTHTDGSGQ